MGGSDGGSASVFVTGLGKKVEMWHYNLVVYRFTWKQ